MHSWTVDEVNAAFEVAEPSAPVPVPAKPKAANTLKLTRVPKSELLEAAALLKVGFEFTFTHKSKKERDRRSAVVAEKEFDALVIARKYFDKPIRELVRYFKTDDECIECSYPPTLDLEVQINLFNDLKALMHPWVPYVSESRPEGGMHINICWYNDNIRSIIKAIPAVAWVFAPGSDNENSTINGLYNAAAYARSGYTEYRCVAPVNHPAHVRLAAGFFRRFSAYARLCRGFPPRGDVNYSLDKNPFDQELAKFNKLLERLYLDPSDYTWFVDSHMRIRYMHEAKNPGKFLT